MPRPKRPPPPRPLPALPPESDLDALDLGALGSLDLSALPEIAAATDEGARIARALLKGCNARADERIVILVDESTDEILQDIFFDTVMELGDTADPALVSLRTRDPAYEGLPGFVVGALLAAELVLDLTTVPWTFSDSYVRFETECRQTGTRLAYIGGEPEGIPTFLACHPSTKLRHRAERGLDALQGARTVHVAGAHGTDFTAELGDPADYPRRFIGDPAGEPGQIGAPLYMSVAAPFVPGTARGTLAFTGAARMQTPLPEPLWVTTPVTLRIEDGRVTEVVRNGEAADILADWFEAAESEETDPVVGCNVGFDPRGSLQSADNMVVHCFDGGFMFGIGRPVVEHRDGARTPGSHLDLMLQKADVDLDGTPFIRSGSFTRQSGVR